MALLQIPQFLFFTEVILEPIFGTVPDKHAPSETSMHGNPVLGEGVPVPTTTGETYSHEGK